ncbi:MAG: alpha/beta hydrolase-fold protein [Planctomycetota bacterium]
MLNTTRRWACLALLSLMGRYAAATEVLIEVTDISGGATPETPIHLASSMNNWNPGDPGAQLSPREDGVWTLLLGDLPVGTRLEFKFTLGSWASVEQDAAGADIPNRVLVVPQTADGTPHVEHLRIQRFRDPGTPQGWLDPDREIDVVGGRLERLTIPGGAGPAVDLQRTVLVWIPEAYDAAQHEDARFPVLYMQDGQNLFETLPGQPGDWAADDAAAAVIASGDIFPFLIVGVPHGGTARMHEYVGFENLRRVEPAGDGYLRWLIDDVVSEIDARYRTIAEPDARAIGGSSLGGLISLHAGLEHPDVFGLVLAESISIVLDPEAFWGWIERYQQAPARLFLGVGTREYGDGARNEDRNARYVAEVRRLKAWALAHGATEDSLRLLVADGALHTESAWRARLSDAMRFVWGDRSQ